MTLTTPYNQPKCNVIVSKMRHPLRPSTLELNMRFLVAATLETYQNMHGGGQQGVVRPPLSSRRSGGISGDVPLHYIAILPTHCRLQRLVINIRSEPRNSLSQGANYPPLASLATRGPFASRGTFECQKPLAARMNYCIN